MPIQYTCQYSLCQKPFLEYHRNTPRSFCSLACKKASEPERFWSYVQKTETCWLWIGTHGIGLMGYGQFSAYGGTHILAHRYSYILAYGKIPDGLCVCHTCDNPLCVNPAHLWIGTRTENNKDMYQKGRGKFPTVGNCPHGSGHVLAKMTEEQALEIFTQKGKMTITSAAEKYGYGRSTIYRIWIKESWKHIHDPIS